jgi:CRP-like cAMP-binding protein
MASADALRASRLFSRLDDETLERIAPAFTEADFPASHVLIEPRTTGAGLFVICDGSVVVEVHGTPRRLGPGDVVGEISMLEEQGTRRVRVVAETPVRCLALARPALERILDEEPQLGAALRELAERRLAEL